MKGVPLEDVSELLGHASIAVTEKYYAPWVASRKLRLERLLSETLAKTKRPLIQGLRRSCRSVCRMQEPMPSNFKTPGSFLNKVRIVAGEKFHIAANSLGL